MQLIDAKTYWDYYFRNDFLVLERGPRGCRGVVYARAAPSATGKGLLQERERLQVTIGIAALGAYDYQGDPRFALLAARPTEPAAAIDAILDKTYPYRDAAPFGKQRMADLFSGELFVPINQQRAPGQTVISVDMLERAVSLMASQYRDELVQPLAALAWLLGELRMRSSGPALLTLVRNAAFVPFAKNVLPTVVTDSALSALWKVDDKSVLPSLVELMADGDNATRRKLAPLFERLLSTAELLSLERCGDDYFQPEFWRAVLSDRRARSAAEWDHHDARALFWELRYLAAQRLRRDDHATLSLLAGDEVATIAAAAKARIAA